MRVVVVTPPEPIVSWEEARAHLRLDSDEEEAYVTALVAAAQQWIDGPAGWLGRAIGVQTLKIDASERRAGCPLPFPPFIDVVEGDVAAEGSVTYRAGYETIPAPIKQAVLLLVGQWYSYRGNVAEEGRPAEMPMAVEALLSPYRVWA